MRNKYIKIFEQELENSRAVIGDSEKAVINALEDVSARAGSDIAEAASNEGGLRIYSGEVNALIDYFADYYYDETMAEALVGEIDETGGLPAIFNIRDQLAAYGAAQEREYAWLGISRADREAVKPYTDAIMDDAFDGTLEVICDHADSIMILPAEKDAATEHKIETMLYQVLKYGAYVFYRVSKWSVRDRMYVLQMSGGKIIPLSGREARAAYKSKICEGLACAAETEPAFETLALRVPEDEDDEDENPDRADGDGRGTEKAADTVQELELILLHDGGEGSVDEEEENEEDGKDEEETGDGDAEEDDSGGSGTIASRAPPEFKPEKPIALREACTQTSVIAMEYGSGTQRNKFSRKTWNSIPEFPAMYYDLWHVFPQHK